MYLRRLDVVELLNRNLFCLGLQFIYPYHLLQLLYSDLVSTHLELSTLRQIGSELSKLI